MKLIKPEFDDLLNFFSSDNNAENSNSTICLNDDSCKLF